MTDDNGKCRGFGFVGFEDHESAQKVSLRPAFLRTGVFIHKFLDAQVRIACSRNIADLYSSLFCQIAAL